MMKKKPASLTFEKSIKTYSRISDSRGTKLINRKKNQEDEFHSFGLNIAWQLRQLPMENALRLQVEMQKLLAEERILLQTSARLS